MQTLQPRFTSNSSAIEMASSAMTRSLSGRQAIDYRAVLRAALRSDLGAFVAKVFQTVSPGDLYHHNWHIDAILFEIQRVMNGDNRRLIVTQPPRSLKSICTSVAFVAWCLGHDPSLRFICVSYSQDLAATFGRQFRAVVRSDWYRELFPGMRL
jgi:hypothetical protein